MSTPVMTTDGNILWLAIAKTGSPPAWSQNTNYEIGDVVVPTAPMVGQENLAFQCVGFLAKSSGVQPVFPVSVGQTIVDGEAEWRCVNPEADPVQLPYNRYYLITQTVTVV